jgi:hypothetical protein
MTESCAPAPRFPSYNFASYGSQVTAQTGLGFNRRPAAAIFASHPVQRMRRGKMPSIRPRKTMPGNIDVFGSLAYKPRQVSAMVRFSGRVVIGLAGSSVAGFVATGIIGPEPNSNSDGVCFERNALSAENVP